MITFFIPVDDLEMAKKYYENNLGLKVKFVFSDYGNGSIQC